MCSFCFHIWWYHEFAVVNAIYIFMSCDFIHALLWRMNLVNNICVIKYSCWLMWLREYMLGECMLFQSFSHFHILDFYARICYRYCCESFWNNDWLWEWQIHVKEFGSGKLEGLKTLIAFANLRSDEKILIHFYLEQRKFIFEQKNIFFFKLKDNNRRRVASVPYTPVATSAPSSMATSGNIYECLELSDSPPAWRSSSRSSLLSRNAVFIPDFKALQ